MKKQARKPAKVVKKASRKAAKKIAKKVAKAGSALEKRVRLLEDIEEISKLKARYCNGVDGGWDRLTHDYDGVAALFVEDGIWEAGNRPELRGETREGIRQYFKAAQNISLAFHRITNPIIEVDSDTATGNWHVLVALTNPNGESVWIAGIYNDDFVRTAEGWKFKKLSFTFAFNTPFDKPPGPGAFYRKQADSSGVSAGNGPEA
jgi:SnoaL-like domain